MKKGYLSQYFTGVATKRLSEVEADIRTSHQHEFNGVEPLKDILGTLDGREKIRFKTKFLYFSDQDPEPVSDDGEMTWYDARAKARLERGVKRFEHRLYFSSNAVLDCAAEGDLVLIAKKQDMSLLVVIAENGSTISRQLLWLFGMLDSNYPDFSIRSELETEQDRIEFASRVILENIGIEVEVADESYLDRMLRCFNGRFPETRCFSAYARSTLPDLNPADDPDAVIIAWVEREEILFRTLERYLIADRLQKGFSDGTSGTVDVDGFMNFSLSVQNRRKSRAGSGLENHLEEIFKGCGIRYSRSAFTECKKNPDFLFPGSYAYHDPLFESLNLTMLGVKTTCKDRWRQVLSEAARINEKHLFTLETAISEHQTDEMKSDRLQLVLPSSLYKTYTTSQQSWLKSLSGFINIVKEKQKYIKI